MNWGLQEINFEYAEMDLGLREIQNAHPRNSSTCPLTTLSKTQYVKELVEILTPSVQKAWQVCGNCEFLFNGCDRD